ncbi:hypothetical protein ACX80I_08040 [Arthrobacter sp. MDT3-44]
MATRRDILAGMVIVPLLVAETACNGGSMDSGQPTGTAAGDPAVLTARPGTAEPGTGTRPGVHALGVATRRDPIVFVPESVDTDEPVLSFSRLCLRWMDEHSMAWRCRAGARSRPGLG